MTAAPSALQQFGSLKYVLDRKTGHSKLRGLNTLRESGDGEVVERLIEHTREALSTYIGTDEFNEAIKGFTEIDVFIFTTKLRLLVNGRREWVNFLPRHLDASHVRDEIAKKIGAFLSKKCVDLYSDLTPRDRSKIFRNAVIMILNEQHKEAANVESIQGLNGNEIKPKQFFEVLDNTDINPETPEWEQTIQLLINLNLIDQEEIDNDSKKEQFITEMKDALKKAWQVEQELERKILDGIDVFKTCDRLNNEICKRYTASIKRSLKIVKKYNKYLDGLNEEAANAPSLPEFSKRLDEWASLSDQAKELIENLSADEILELAEDLEEEKKIKKDLEKVSTPNLFRPPLNQTSDLGEKPMSLLKRAFEPSPTGGSNPELRKKEKYEAHRIMELWFTLLKLYRSDTVKNAKIYAQETGHPHFNATLQAVITDKLTIVVGDQCQEVYPKEVLGEMEIKAIDKNNPENTEIPTKGLISVILKMKKENRRVENIPDLVRSQIILRELNEEAFDEDKYGDEARIKKATIEAFYGKLCRKLGLKEQTKRTNSDGTEEKCKYIEIEPGHFQTKVLTVGKRESGKKTTFPKLKCYMHIPTSKGNSKETGNTRLEHRMLPNDTHEREYKNDNMEAHSYYKLEQAIILRRMLNRRSENTDAAKAIDNLYNLFLIRRRREKSLKKTWNSFQQAQMQAAEA